MMKNIFKGWCIIISVVIVLLGCSTIPAPGSDTDTLFIVPMGVEGKGSQPVFDYTLWIKSGSAKEKAYALATHKNYAIIHGLAPGKHIITHIGFYQSGDRYKIGLPIELKPKTLHVAPFIVVTKMTTHSQSLDIRPFEFKDKVEFLQNLQDDENYSLWEVEYK